MKNFLRPIFGGSDLPDSGNAYLDILGIPVSEQPANLYRLLDLPLFESNEKIIHNAARIRKRAINTNSNKVEHDVLIRLTEEIDAAEHILSDKEKRLQYDREYRVATDSEPNPEPHEELPAEHELPVEQLNTAHSDLIGNQLLDALATENATLKARSNEWIRMSVDYQKQLEAKDQEISSIQKQLELLAANDQQRTESLTLSHDNFKHDLQIKQQEIEDRDSQIKNLADQNQKLQSDLIELTSDFEKVEKQNKSLISKFKVAGPKIKGYKSEIKNLQEQLSQEANNKNSFDKASSEQMEKIAALTKQIESLTEKLASLTNDFEKQKQSLLSDNAQLKKLLDERPKDDLFEKVDHQKPAAGSVEKTKPIFEGVKDALSEIGGIAVPDRPQSTQVKKSNFSNPISKLDEEKIADSKNTSSSLVALSNDEAEGQLGNSSLCHADDDSANLNCLRFRIRDRLGGNIVLDKRISDGDCIKIGRLSDFCTFEVLAKRLSTDRVLSGRHFQLVFTDDSVTVEDVGSTNGTLAAGEMLKGQKKTIAFQEFKDNFFKIRAGELFQFEMELVETEVAFEPKKPAATAAEVGDSLGDATLGSAAPPVDENQLDRAAENDSRRDNSLVEPGFSVESDKDQSSNESSSRDSLEWDE